MPNLQKPRIIGSYNLTCRLNPNHKKNEWCGACLADQQAAVKVPKTTKKTKSKSKPPKKKTTSLKKSQLVSLPSVPKATKSKTSTPDYYNCLMNYAQQGFYDSSENKKLKIHSCCQKCKLSAPSLNSERDKELVKLITSYKQVGDSLGKLLRPIK